MNFTIDLRTAIYLYAIITERFRCEERKKNFEEENILTQIIKVSKALEMHERRIIHNEFFFVKRRKKIFFRRP